MIIYQLPNGKIISLTIEEYINLSDEDISYLVSIDFGESAANPWLGSVLSSSPSNLDLDLDSDEIVPPDLFIGDTE